MGDTTPTGLVFLSATATVGSYHDGTGLWDLGSLVPGAADTLRIRVEVMTATPGTVTNIAEFLGLLLEVDPNAANNLAGAVLTMS